MQYDTTAPQFHTEAIPELNSPLHIVRGHTSASHALGRRIGELAAGFLLWNVSDYAFDYLLYPTVVWMLGPFLGGGIMAIMSLIACLALIRLYDYLGRDWLGIEFAKGFRDYAGESRLRKWVASAMRRSDAVAFLFLSAKYDPFITTAYLRRKSFGGLDAREWSIFFGSWLLSNLIWIAACTGGIELVRNFVVIGR